MARKERYRGSGSPQAVTASAEGIGALFSGVGTPQANRATSYGGALNQAGYYGIGVEQAVRAVSTGAGTVYLPVNQEGSGTAQATRATASGIGSNTLSAPIERTSKSEHEIRTYSRR